MAEHEESGTAVAAPGWGVSSMAGRLRTVMVRVPAPSARAAAWQAFGYLHPTDDARAVQEHTAFRQMLAGAGVEVVTTGGDDEDAGLMDAIFTYDPSIMTPRGAILCRPGKPLRLPEVDLAAKAYARRGIPIVGRIEAPGTLEGGDTLWLDAQTVAVGRGYRTNDAGIEQLTALLAPQGIEVIPVALPHWHGPSECLHLMSMISPVDDKLAVVYLPLLATSFVELLQQRGWQFVEVPDAEFDSMGCNVLALAPRHCLMLEGNPETRRRLEASGCTVRTYVGDEISRNRAGGPTCLSRPLWRE